MVTEGHITFAYDPVLNAVATDDPGTPLERHSLITVEPQRSDLQEVATDVFLQATGRPGHSRRLARRFTGAASTLQHDPTILAAAREDFIDTDYIRTGASTILATLVPDYALPSPLEFEVTDHDGSYRVQTNIDFAAANRLYQRRVPTTHSTLSAAQLLVMMYEAREHISLAASEGTELLVSEARALLVDLRLASLLDHARLSQEHIGCFQDFVFDDSRAIRDVISSGERTIAELVPLLDGARSWKLWLAERPLDADLLREYWKAAFARSWVDRLPVRAARWALFTGAGVAADLAGAGGVGTALGVGLSLVDGLLVQRLLTGWTPNQFVEGPLRGFLRTDRPRQASDLHPKS